MASRSWPPAIASGPDDGAAEQDVDRQAAQLQLTQHAGRVCVAGAQPRADLNLTRVQERREERIGDVGGEVRFESVDAKERCQTERQDQMEADERRRTDEEAERNRRGLPPRRVVLGSVSIERGRQSAGPCMVCRLVRAMIAASGCAVRRLRKRDATGRDQRAVGRDAAFDFDQAAEPL